MTQSGSCDYHELDANEDEVQRIRVSSKFLPISPEILIGRIHRDRPLAYRFRYYDMEVYEYRNRRPHRERKSFGQIEKRLPVVRGSRLFLREFFVLRLPAIA